MKSKFKLFYVCENCGYESPKWLGKCPECQSWNTFIEDVKGGDSTSVSKVNSKNKPYKLSEIETDIAIRYKTGVEEFDRVLGGGLVKGLKSDKSCNLKVILSNTPALLAFSLAISKACFDLSKAKAWKSFSKLISDLHFSLYSLVKFGSIK